MPARYVVLVIDDIHMEFESLVRIRKALGRFLDEDLRPEDQVALVTTSGAKALSQEFTSDRASLRQTLTRVSVQCRPPDSPVGHLSRIRLQPLDPGEYELRITVTDANASTSVSRAIAFKVD